MSYNERLKWLEDLLHIMESKSLKEFINSNI